MTPKQFPSKIDAWLLVVLAVTLACQLGVLVWVLYSEDGAGARWLMVGITLLVILLIGSVVLRTYYRIDGDTLLIVSGPFRWRVPIGEIHSIESTHNPLSSPALSLDRLRIRFSGRKSIMISPADKPRFLRALGWNGRTT